MNSAFLHNAVQSVQLKNVTLNLTLENLRDEMLGSEVQTHFSRNYEAQMNTV